MRPGGEGGAGSMGSGLAAAWARCWSEGLRAPPGGVSPALSERIKVARVLCIAFMIYVHINPGEAQFAPFTHAVSAFDWVRFFFADTLGRTSTGLLAAVSGYLLIATGGLSSFRRLVAKRFESLVVPMTLWSAAALGMGALGEALSPGYFASHFVRPWSWGELPNFLLGITHQPANLPLGFVRDLFACALVTPVLAPLLRRLPVLTLAGLLAVMLLKVQIWVVLAPNVLLFFAVGVFLAQRGRTLMDWIDRRPRWVIGAFLGYALALTAVDMELHVRPHDAWRPYYDAAFELQRFLGAAAFWALAGWAARAPFAPFLRRLEPFAFLTFCSHLLVTTPVWFLWQKVFGGYYGALYPVFFFSGPALSFAGAIALAHLLDRVAPGVLYVLNGGRPISGERRARPVAAPGQEAA